MEPSHLAEAWTRVEASGRRVKAILVVDLRGEAGGERFELDAYLEEFAQLDAGKPPHERAAVRHMLDEALGGQATQSFPDRPAADVKA